jgi:hypothetical protein
MPNRAPTGSFFRPHDLLLLVIAGILVAAGYAWLLSPDPADQEARYPAHRYFAWQAEAWLAGRLDLARELPAGLAQLKDPYDPAANEPFRMGGANGVHDLSLYQGKLYLYWAPGPALAAFLPWRVVTGRPLPTAWACWGFAWAAWLGAAVLLARVVRRHFPDTARWALGAGLVALAACSWAPIVLRRANVWEVPIFAACCFGVWAWWAMAEWGWARESARRWWWLAGASLGWGLAVGSRPIWIVASGFLMLPLWIERRQWRTAGFRRLALAVALPLGLVVAGLLAHNYLRFGSGFEFGQRWQLAGAKVQEARLFSPAYLWFNLREYLVSVPSLVAYFPFLDAPAPVTPPAGHFGTDGSFGVLVVAPFFWWAVFAPRTAALRPAVWPAAVGFGCLLLVLAGFAGVTARYELEIASPLALLAALGAIAWLAEGKGPAVLRSALCLGPLGISLLAALLLGERFALVTGGRGGWPTAWVRTAERVATWSGWAPESGLAAVELTVKFPAQGSLLTPDAQVLLASGLRSNREGVAVDYPDAGTVRFHFFQGAEVRSTDPLPLDRAVPHVVQIELGGLLPPAHHPFWRETPREVVAQKRSRVRIDCDRRELFNGSGLDFSPVDAEPEIGAMATGTGRMHLFTGEIIARRMERILVP